MEAQIREIDRVKAEAKKAEAGRKYAAHEKRVEAMLEESRRAEAMMRAKHEAMKGESEGRG